MTSREQGLRRINAVTAGFVAVGIVGSFAVAAVARTETETSTSTTTDAGATATSDESDTSAAQPTWPSLSVTQGAPARHHGRVVTAMPLTETLPLGPDTAQWPVWSTTARVVVTDPVALPAAREIVRAVVEAVDKVASRFRSESEINQLHQARGRPQQNSPLLTELVQTALAAAQRTDGDVDPTVGAAVSELGYDRDFRSLPPNGPPVRVVRRVAADWRQVRLAGHQLTVPAGVWLDLGATAKAFTADRCASLVARWVGVGALVGLGGDIATAGPAPDGGWRILVQDRPGDPSCVVALPAGSAIATSSTMSRRWRHGERLRHHIVDPRTCQPVESVWRCATVAAHTSVEANTLTTAALVRGRYGAECAMTAILATETARLLAAGVPDLVGHERRNGPLPWRGGRGLLIPTLEAAGLTGRGDAGFPTWRKLAAVSAGGRRPVVVGNAAEGEPASAKDATLLATAPHLVLDGLQLAAETVGAEEVYLYAKPGPPTDQARYALAERHAGSWNRYTVRLVEAPGRFVAGEESAVVAAIEGQSAVPRDKRRPMFVAGVRGRPTLVQNVETLAHLALIARHGPAWFRQAGTAEEPGTFLATVSGAVRTPGVVEASYGLRIGDLLDLADGRATGLRAILVGGRHGVWLPADGLRVPLSRAGLQPWGGSPGAGVVVALPDDACGLAATARIVSYLAEQGAGQCGPCLNGLPRIAHALGALAEHQTSRVVTEIKWLSDLV